MASREFEAYDSEEKFDISDVSYGHFTVGELDSEGQIQPYMYEPSYIDDIEQNTTDENLAGASSRLNVLT